ncbi:MAG: Ig-like domain-containing protein [Candidatus Shapirobacteria bacterium]|jgi:hypothetical protein
MLRKVLLFFFCFLVLKPTSVYSATTISRSITSGPNDSKVTNGVFSATDTTAQLGRANNNPTRFFFLFTNVTVPQGSTIDSAYMGFTATGSNAGTVSLLVAAQNISSPTAPASVDEFTTFQGNLTSSTIPWTNLPSVGWGVGFTSPDFSTIIAEIVNRQDWVSGNSIQIFINDNNSAAWSNRTVIMGNHTGAEAKPSLVITYSVPVVIPNSPSSLSQYRSDGSTALAAGETTPENQVVLKFSMDSENSSDTLTPEVEVRQIGVSFDGTPNYFGLPLEYVGPAVTGSVPVTGLTYGQSYHWQSRITNSAGSSPFVAAGSSPDFIVGPLVPTTSDNTDSSWHSGIVSVTLTCTNVGGPGCASTYYTTDGSIPSLSSSSGNTVSFFMDGVYTLKYFSTDTNGVAESPKTASNTVKIDTTPPSGGSLSYNDGFYVNPSVSFTAVDGTDSGSGIDTSSRVFYRRLATMTDQICGSYGSWSTIDLSGTYPNYSDDTVVLGNCYQYKYDVGDNLANETTYTSNNTAKIEDIANLTVANFSKSIASGSHDCHLIVDTFHNTETTAQLGKSSNQSTNHFFLFENVTIARGTNLSSAKLRLTLSGSGADTVNVRIKAVNAASPTIPTDSATFLTKQEQLTSQYVDWSAVPLGTFGTGITSPDLTSVLQTVINRSDWVSGNSILLWVGNNNSTTWSTSTFFTADYTGSEPKPTLDISYVYSNSSPTPQNDSIVTNTQATFSPLSNDTDPDNDVLTLDSVSAPGHGTAVISGTQIIYTPTAGFLGDDTFTYTVSDGNNHTAQASVSVEVLANPIYYTLSFTADKSAVPSLYYQQLTYLVHLGTVDEATVTTGDTTVVSHYSSLTGDLWFTSPQNSFELLIKNPSDPTVFTVSKSALKDHKSFAWSHGMDDNVNLAAQVALLNSKNWRGTFNLIGNIIQDARNESWIYDKPVLTTLLQQGWALSNHTYNHQCVGDQISDPEFMENTILNGYNKIMEIVSASSVPGYKVLGFAAPCFVSAYDAYVLAMRTAAATSIMYNESQSNGLMRIDQDAASYSNSGRVALAVDSDTIKIGRDMSIETDYSVTNSIMDWMSANASSSRHFWLNTLTHGNKEASLGQVIDHVYDNYGPGGSDEVWVAPATEIYSYFLVRDKTVLSTPTSVNVADGSPPAITSVSLSDYDNNSASFTWHTDLLTSSKVVFGVNSSVPSATDEEDISTRVYNHSVQIGSLLSCTKYYYRTVSTSAYSATGQSSIASFITTGCPNSATVLDSNILSVAANIGATQSFSNSDGSLVVNIPSGFSQSNATFQALQLNKDPIIASISAPSNHQLIGNFLVRLSALTSASSTISQFELPLSITLSYGADDVTNINESGLKIYRHDGSLWHELDNCTVNQNSRTVTCQTSDFSIFGIFGPPLPPSPTPTLTPTPTSTPTSSPTSTATPAANSATTSQASSNATNSVPGCSDPQPASIPDLFQINVTATTAKLFFTPISDTTEFYISFSALPTAEDHGARVSLAREGVQNFTVNSLKPNTTYYFKLRGQNGCQTGVWSNIVKAKTIQKDTGKPQTYYKKTTILKKIISKIVSVISPKTPSKNPASKQSPSPPPSLVVADTPTPKPAKTPLPQKTCFLWWCW